MDENGINKVIELFMADEFFKFIGLRIQYCGSGRSRVVLPVTDNVKNPAGKVHGGIINAICSAASSLAAMSVLEPGKYTAASDFNSSVFSNVSSGTIICEGSVLKTGKRLIFVETKVMNEEGKLLAAGRVTKAVLP